MYSEIDGTGHPAARSEMRSNQNDDVPIPEQNRKTGDRSDRRTNDSEINRGSSMNGLFLHPLTSQAAMHYAQSRHSARTQQLVATFVLPCTTPAASTPWT